ncbi:hypothetical protein LZG04_25805 [Saccharothrix sp. S26]|uniref:hypothetical protein n=1 Tax=Saccharothrix sp. S26 TaxID=2907215 RepID=UPI001F402483|nr:hypothetical protein [Saccharothrix sp. S26]MCE6998186.1 hypothetical protein [Saccharothrix sp. S26]
MTEPKDEMSAFVTILVPMEICTLSSCIVVAHLSVESARSGGLALEVVGGGVVQEQRCPDIGVQHATRQ